MQVRGIRAFCVTFVSIDQENNLANFILKLQRRTLSLVNEQCKIIIIYYRYKLLIHVTLHFKAVFISAIASNAHYDNQTSTTIH